MSNYYDPSPPRSNNTATIVLVVVLAILALVVLVCGGFGLALYMVVRPVQQTLEGAWEADEMVGPMSHSLVSEGRYQEAIETIDAALQEDPENADLLNSKAWLLATCPDSSIRDGQEAVKLANQACSLTDFQSAAYIDTLAAAHAELGEFDKAAEWQEQALDINVTAELGEGMRQRLLLYRAESPYREGPDGQPVMTAQDAWSTDATGSAADAARIASPDPADSVPSDATVVPSKAVDDDELDDNPDDVIPPID